MDRGYEVHREVHPKNSASIFSLLTFRYIHKLLRRGNRKDLQEDDICKVWKKFKINKSGDEIEKLWYSQENSTKGRSIINLLVSCFLTKYLLLGFFQLIVKILNVIVVPYSFGKLLSFFKVGQTEITTQEAWYFGITVIITNLFFLMYDQQYSLYKIEIGMQIFTSICSLLYRKILRLDPSKISEISSGKLISIITKDLSMVEESMYYLNEIWIETISGIIAFYLLFQKIGTATLFGLTCYTITIIIQAMIAKYIYTARYTVNIKTDKRLYLLQEILSFIRIIKMYTWEKFFAERIAYARKEEVKKFGTMTFVKFISFSIGNFCQKMSFFGTILFYIYLGNDLSAEVVYYSEICFKNIGVLINFIMTTCATVLAEFFASVHRIEIILNAEESIENHGKFSESVINPKVDLESVTVNFENTPILKNLNMKLRCGFHFLFGPMGCGKTLLLKTIIGEHPVRGKINVEGGVSYVPQDPWIFPSSIKQNILFGQLFDEKRYRKILDICALKFDLKTLAEGDETIIKDCDMNLSKGQQARINIARGLYKESDIYIFDDPFASLDNRVKIHIFHQIRRYLDKKLVIFSTNDSKFIEKSNNVICMSKGRICFIGKPEDIPKEIITNTSEITSPQIEHNEETSCDEESKLLTNIPSKISNIYNEDQETAIETGWKVYFQYFKFGGGVPILIVIFVLYVVVEATSASSEKLLSKWVQREENVTSLLEENVDRIFYVTWYSSLVLISCTLMTITITVHFIFSLKVAINLHKSMIQRIISSTMNFFDENMAGNIMNRLSKDLYQIDEFIPFVIIGTMLTCTSLFSTAMLVSSVNLEFTALTLCLLVIFIMLCRYFLKPIKSLKKLANSTRSPMVGYFNATLNGLSVIRTYGTKDILVKEFDKHQDLYICSRHLFEISMRCLAFSLNFFSTLYTSTIILRFLYAEKGESSADVGLAVTQSFALSSYFDGALRQWIFLEALMVCFKRTAEYTEIAEENQKGQTLLNWPNEGRIRYENVNLTYKAETNLILKNINFTIQPREKIGIVGRTGAGKSTLVLTLFRLYKFHGKILIDDVDINTTSLENLRKSIAIIPQDPLVFSGSIRDNIDPLRMFSDNQIWRALSDVSLKPHIKSLDDDISECNIFHSLGQKQLLSIARAIVRKTKIIVFDESTSSMDDDTGILINRKITELFSNNTVIIIAHRLKFVMDCDRVMVLENGEIVEFDQPEILAQNQHSVFSKMINNIN